MPLLPDNKQYLSQLSHMAAVYRKFGQFVDAENLYHEIIDDLTRAGLLTDQRLALAMCSLAELLSVQQRNKEALPHYKSAVSIWEQTHPVESLSLLWYSEACSKMQQLIDDQSDNAETQKKIA